ncbi:MAG: 3'-5' exonuclease [Candidatus Binatia bacterium]
MEFFFDTETTGLFDYKKDLADPEQPRIISIAGVLAEEGRIVEQFSAIVKHATPVINPPVTLAINGITQEMMEAGTPMAEVIERIEEMASRAQKSVAHNMSFDMAMWNRETVPIGIESKLRALPRFCTMKRTDEFKIFKLPNKLIDLYLHLFGKPFDGQHHALSDALACMNVYYELMDMIGAGSKETAAPVATIAEMF